ncbi:TatD family hydrolase [Pseudoalteromonas luteoviolacea]|uniref:TatD family hydrolase n=1 Tax=Pseudoalteromonas luteoviolacea TaxID=43657 RepID=UPI001B35BE83|nr:TatD family hydrolase [Pseudoalteromonas luteoviolacea]MBQ4837746.1 TatD family hydrolase [Pseudoalteromonas luteoviolacea]
MRFIDSHCHLDFAEFADNVNQQISDAASYGIEKLIVPGVSLAQCKRLTNFQQTHSCSYIAFGLHPYFLTPDSRQEMTQLVDLATRYRQELVAIGECGIDSQCADLALQQAIFADHIRLANTLELPLIVHHRQSHHLIAQSFKQIKPKFGGVIHAFSGSRQQAQYYVNLGFKLGLGGTITYPRAKKTRDVVSALPLSSFVIETDAPSMPVFGHQGQVNTPARLMDVFTHVCQLRSEPKEVIALSLYTSTCELFSI